MTVGEAEVQRLSRLTSWRTRPIRAGSRMTPRRNSVQGCNKNKLVLEKQLNSKMQEENLKNVIKIILLTFLCKVRITDSIGSLKQIKFIAKNPI